MQTHLYLSDCGNFIFLLMPSFYVSAFSTNTRNPHLMVLTCQQIKKFLDKEVTITQNEIQMKLNNQNSREIKLEKWAWRG